MRSFVCIVSMREPTPFSSTGELDSSELTVILKESFNHEVVLCDPILSGCAFLACQTTGNEGVEMVRLPNSLCSVVGEEAWK